MSEYRPGNPDILMEESLNTLNHVMRKIEKKDELRAKIFDELVRRVESLESRLNRLLEKK